MDRFIGSSIINTTFLLITLKSNMDRFIGACGIDKDVEIKASLKSNMDRFIGGLISNQLQIFSVFKIQYG